MDGLNTVLPIGHRKINALRTLTTENLAVLMPFRVQEIMDEGGIYCGENAISHNLIMCNKAKLLNSNSFLLGVPGSGKSFSAKMLIVNLALASGGWIAILILIIVILFGGFLGMTGGDNSATVTSVSAEVQAYEPVIRKYAKQYGIGEYVELIKAVMMQESGGRGSDPMQSSEGSFNTKYPKQPGGIADLEYSIECGVQEIKSCLVGGEVKTPLDMDNIRLALQGYNYGNGYIPWAKENYGGYTLANAAEFSNKMAEEKGWESCGDKQYVPHVLRYYSLGRIPNGIGNQAIVQVALSQEGNGGDTYWSWYGFTSRVSWCACFVSWCGEQCGYLDSGIMPKFSLCSDGAK